MRQTWVLAFFLVLFLAQAAVSAQERHRNRKENAALLGVVAIPANDGVEVVHVLPDSPASKAKIEIGDIIVGIGKKPLKSLWDLDDLLSDTKPDEQIALQLVRKKKKGKATATLIARNSYKGDFLESRRRGETGFVAPEWFAYGWANTSKSTPAPTRKNTKGKVVVFHCFQS